MLYNSTHSSLFVDLQNWQFEKYLKYSLLSLVLVYVELHVKLFAEFHSLYPNLT